MQPESAIFGKRHLYKGETYSLFLCKVTGCSKNNDDGIVLELDGTTCSEKDAISPAESRRE